MRKLLFGLSMLGLFGSLSAFANCDISEVQGTKEKFALVLKAKIQDPNVKYLLKSEYNKLGSDVLNCFNEVDIAFELGDGYYDFKFKDVFAVYDLNSKRLAGFIEISAVTYSEANDPSELKFVEVRYNDLGQRITKIGEY